MIGVVGGIGSGKSAVARKLAERRPLLIIDADRIGHELLHSSTVQQQLIDLFGPEVAGADGSLSRPAIAALVFGPTDQHTSAREALNSILHPLIRDEVRQRIADAKEHGGYQAVVLDAALMLETGWHNDCDAVVFIDVPESIRRQRVIENRGWTAAELTRRERSQFDLQKKQSFANYTIDNSSTLEDAAEAFEQILDSILQDHPH